MLLSGIKLTDWIQALGSIAAVFIAICAFYISRQTLHMPFRTMLRPIEIKPKEGLPNIRLYNIGPGIAYNTRIYVAIKKSAGKRGRYLYVFEKTDGPDFLRPDSTQDYLCDFPYTIIGLPFVIEYETLTGKRYYDLWQYYIDKRGKESFQKKGLLYKIVYLYLSKEFETREA